MSNELEACLDPVRSEYPALFQEFLLANLLDREDDGLQLGAAGREGWCWVVAQNKLHLWNLKDEKPQYHTFNLLPNGRPYTAQDILIHRRDVSTMCVMAVSSNSTLRYWPTLQSRHHDILLNLNNETTRAIFTAIVQGEERILLLTGVGSVYEIHYLRDNGRLSYKLVASYTQNSGFGVRLTAMFRGNSDIKDKRALRCISVPKNAESEDSALVVLGPGHITVFDESSVQPLFSIAAEELLDLPFGDYFRSRSPAPPTNLRYFLLDITAYKGGLMLLICAVHSMSKAPSFALVYYKSMEELHLQPTWFACCPLANLQLFSANIETSYIDRLSIHVPGDNQASEGIVIIHKTFAQIVQPPADYSWHGLPVNRAVFFPNADRLVGQGSDEKFTYALLAKKGICAVRLLPRGFADQFPPTDKLFGSAQESAKRIFAEHGQMKLANPSLRAFLEAFVEFSATKIKDAKRILARLTEADLCDAVHRFFEELMGKDELFVSKERSISQKLAFRHIVASRIVFFLKKVDAEDTLVRTKCGSFGLLLSRGSSGAAMVTECYEKTAAALALWDWIDADEDHRLMVQYTAEHYAQRHELAERNAYDVFFRNLTAFHQLPTAAVAFVAEQLETSRLATKPVEQVSLLSIACDLLCYFCDAIDRERRKSTCITDPRVVEKWTGGRLSEAIQSMVMMVLKKLDSTVSITSLQRKSAVDQVRRLLFFSLSESITQPEGNEALLLLYNVDERELARDLAERFKDFKILIKIAQACETDRQRKQLVDGWKSKFAADNFDIYLCNYYRTHGMNEELLGENGEQAQHFIEGCEDLRWRRHIMNDEYEKAAQNLLSLGDRTEDKECKENAYVFAKLSAICAGKKRQDLVDLATKKIVDTKSQ
ncbi:unnamed protein product, partial [Mesorhabditis spiculigera]